MEIPNRRMRLLRPRLTTRLNLRTAIARAGPVVAILSSNAPAQAEPAWLRDPPAFVELRGGQLSLDSERVTLKDHADLRVGPVRITAAALTVRRNPAGQVIVEGPAVVAPCPYPSPPLAFSVRRLELGPGARATLYGASVVVFGQPTVPVPWLALRGPDSVGLLPPRLAWRGEDGGLIGTGFFVPFDRDAWVRASPAWYVEGGSDWRLHAQTKYSTARLRWDHRQGENLFAVDARGETAVAGATLAWDADVLRGGRARRATTELDEAARRYDRVATALLVNGPTGPFAVGVRGTGARGLGPGFIGPRVSWSRGIVLGAGSTTLAWTADASSLAQGDNTVWHVARVDSDLASTVWAGPARFNAAVRAGANGWSRPEGPAGEAFALGRLGAGLPLARGFPNGTVHTVEPGVALVTAGDLVRGQSVDMYGRSLVANSGLAGAALLYVDQRFGRPGGNGGSISLATGGIVDNAPVRVALRARGALDTFWARGRSEGALIRGSARGADLRGSERNPSGGVWMGRLEVGPRGSLRVGSRVMGRTGVDPVAARALSPTMSDVGYGGWLVTSGWTVGGDVAVPLGRTLSARVAADVDANRSTRLGERATVHYRHPCGCLDLAATASHRLGRGGVDGLLTLDLFAPAEKSRFGDLPMGSAFIALCA